MTKEIEQAVERAVDEIHRSPHPLYKQSREQDVQIILRNLSPYLTAPEQDAGEVDAMTKEIEQAVEVLTKLRDKESAYVAATIWSKPQQEAQAIVDSCTLAIESLKRDQNKSDAEVMVEWVANTNNDGSRIRRYAYGYPNHHCYEISGNGDEICSLYAPTLHDLVQKLKELPK